MLNCSFLHGFCSNPICKQYWPIFQRKPQYSSMKFELLEYHINIFKLVENENAFMICEFVWLWKKPWHQLSQKHFRKFIFKLYHQQIDLSRHMKLKCCINQFSRFLIQLCWKYWDYFLFHISATVFWPKYPLSQIIRQLAHSKKVHASEMSIIC